MNVSKYDKSADNVNRLLSGMRTKDIDWKVRDVDQLKDQDEAIKKNIKAKMPLRDIELMRWICWVTNNRVMLIVKSTKMWSTKKSMTVLPDWK
jgi:hypothetical protein